MLIVKLANPEIGSAAERYRTSMAKYLPKPLRTLYRGMPHLCSGVWILGATAEVGAGANRRTHDDEDDGLEKTRHSLRTLRKNVSI